MTKDDAGTGAVIRCDDGTSTTVPGGGDRGDCTIEQKGNTKTIRCADGTNVDIVGGQVGVKGNDGEPGPDGADGEPGAKGADGTDGADGANGSDGTNGTNGTNPTSAFVVGPGLAIAVSGVTIPADRQPVVSLSIKDSGGHSLDRTGTTTAGSVSASFVLAYLTSTAGVVGQYVPYTTATVAGKTVMSVAPALASATQPKSDSTGTWTVVDASAGTYTYRFAASLPSDYDVTRTHTLAVYSARTFDGVQYAADPVFHFRPDGAAVTELREIVTTQTCNKCHDSLRVHGGSRFDLGLCITCHVEGMDDPESGNSLDFKQMIHKIHRGENLPSVRGDDGTAVPNMPTPYALVGHNDAVHDYSDVVFPQAMESCTTCHQDGADSDRWKTHMSRAACTSCHDRTSFAAGPAPAGFRKHTAGQQDDTQCVGCHEEGREPIGVVEVDVTKVHVPREKYPLREGPVTTPAPVVTGSIESVTGVQTGQTPVVTFRVAVDGAPQNILAVGSELSTLRFTFAAPTADYAGYAQYTAQSASPGAVGVLAATATPGEFTWTASQTIDSIATGQLAATGTQPFPLTGTMAVGMEGRLTRRATAPDGTQIPAINYPMHNAVFYVALTDATAVPRREATVVESCNTCHGDLRAHGGSRNDPEYCVLCHTAGRDSITRMTPPAPGNLARTTTLRMSTMVHRIHTGEEGARDYFDFAELRFPGDLRNCAHCHVSGQYQLPLPSGLLASRTSDIDSTRARMADYFMGPTAAACTGCHDSESAEVHAATMSIVGGSPSAISESCASCHASGREFGLDAVHARPGL